MTPTALTPRLPYLFFCALLLQALPAMGESKRMKASGSQGEDSIGGDESAKAKALFNSGLALYKAGRYAAALQEFQAAQQITPRKSIQLNIARTHLALKDTESAREAYVLLVRRYGAGLFGQELSAAEREEAEREIINICRNMVSGGGYRAALPGLLAGQEVVIGRSAQVLAMLLGRTREGLGDDLAAYQLYKRLWDENPAQLSDEDRSQLSLGLQRTSGRTGAVRGTILPPGVTIRTVEPNLGVGYLDTIDQAALGQGVRRTLGRQMFEFSKPGYVTQTRVVTIVANGIATVDVTLQPNLPQAQTSSAPWYLHPPQNPSQRLGQEGGAGASGDRTIPEGSWSTNRVPPSPPVMMPTYGASPPGPQPAQPEGRFQPAPTEPSEYGGFGPRMQNRLRPKFTFDFQTGLGLVAMRQWGTDVTAPAFTNALLVGYRQNLGTNFGILARAGAVLGAAFLDYNPSSDSTDDAWDGTSMVGGLLEASPFFGPFGRFYIGPSAWAGYVSFGKADLSATSASHGTETLHLNSGPMYGFGVSSGILLGDLEQLDLTMTWM